MATQTKGMFDDLINIILPELVASIFDEVGEGIVPAIKDGCSKDEGRLNDSLSYAHSGGKGRQARVGDKAFAGDGAPMPDVPNLMYIGTRVRYAWYVEKGTHSHQSDTDAEGFVERVTEWAKRHGWAEDDIPALIKSIRYKGTKAHPFFFDKETLLRRLVEEALVKSMRKLPSMVKRTPPIKLEYSITSTNK